MSDEPPLARRMPGFDARHATKRARRTRTVLKLGAVGVLVAAGAFFAVAHFTGRSASPRHRPPPSPRRPRPPAVVSTLAPWRLGAPISRAVVVPGGAATRVVIIGGLTTGGLTASGAFGLDLSDGSLTQVGDLPTTLDDATGAVIAGADIVFGGTSSSAASSVTADVEMFPATTSTEPSPAPTTSEPVSTVIATLPQPRAGDSAVTVGSTTYLLGGVDAGTADSAVLSTTDGRHFSSVATLPVPVQFPAVAALGTRLYVFGGTAAAGTDVGQPVDAIQVVDTATHRAELAGHLPEPITAAAAVTLGGDLLVAGGDTGATAGAAVSTVPTVWFFDPATATTAVAGHLAVGVAHAGLAVLGSTAWLIGGESGTTPLSGAQSFVVRPPSPPTRRRSG